MAGPKTVPRGAPLVPFFESTCWFQHSKDFRDIVFQTNSTLAKIHQAFFFYDILVLESNAEEKAIRTGEQLSSEEWETG